MVKNQERLPSQRQRRVNENIRQLLTEVLRREDFYDSPLADTSVTITEVSCSPDLKHASVYILPLGGEADDSEPIVSALNAKASHFRHMISHALQMKYSPKLIFKADKSFAHATHIDALLNSERVQRDVDSDT